MQVAHVKVKLCFALDTPVLVYRRVYAAVTVYYSVQVRANTPTPKIQGKSNV